MTASGVDFIDSTERAASLLDPTRLRIVEVLREPGSAATVARVIGLPRQKVNYHLRVLEKQGLVREVEERRKGNCVERIVQATARHYLVDPAALGALGVGASPEEIADRFSATYLIALAAKTIRDVAQARRLAEQAHQRLATFGLTTDVRFASAAARKAFTEELATAVAGLVARYHDEAAPGGRRFTFTIGAYPTMTAKEKIDG
jgi:DNA-binding transcriptional ArsR family regulator